MSDCFIGEIRMFGGNFAPRSWALCQGQLLSISQNTALFSILGTTFGGNGQTTFALPDFRGRVPVGQGQGPGLSNYSLGQQAGSENTTMTVNQMPAHNHGLFGYNTDADNTKPAGNLCANAAGNTYAPSGPPVAMNAQGTSTQGGSQPFGLLQPYLCINFIICLEGLYPSRN